MQTRFCLLAACFLSCTISLAQDVKDERRTRDKPADAAELAQITSRGRALSAYDELAWHATDAVQAYHPAAAESNMYLGVQTANGLVMGFGRLNAAHTSFLLAYESVPATPARKPQILHHEPAREETGDWLHEALAFTTVKPLIQGQAKIYNIAILPAEEGRWFVYAYPAQTDNNVFPTGSDVRYLVSADGSTVEATHRMHFSLLQWNAAPKESKEVTTFRTAVLDDAPEDTDVAVVLMMGGVPSYVATRKFVYIIDAAGDIKYLTTTDVFTKQSKEKPPAAAGRP